MVSRDVGELKDKFFYVNSSDVDAFLQVKM